MTPLEKFLVVIFLALTFCGTIYFFAAAWQAP
jgi:hypothetical protein